jgi:hypothetical protein
MNFTAMFNHYNIVALINDGDMRAAKVAVNLLDHADTIQITLGKVGVS